MHIVVCIKQILDPEIPPRDFRIDVEAREPVRGNAQLVIGPFDENALELAVQLKEKVPGAKITVLTYGGGTAKDALRKALAIGCDEAALLLADEAAKADTFVTAAVLAAAIRRLGGADLVLCGRQAGDWDQGQVGPVLAEALELPVVALAWQAVPDGEKLVFQREVEGGYERVEATLPVLATVTNHESNQMRLPKVRDVLMANRKTIHEWPADELAPEAKPRLDVRALTIPKKESRLELIEGDNDEEKAKKLVERLRALNLI